MSYSDKLEEKMLANGSKEDANLLANNKPSEAEVIDG